MCDHIFRGDDTRSKNWSLKTNLAVIRVGLLNLKAQLLPNKLWTEIRQAAQYNLDVLLFMFDNCVEVEVAVSLNDHVSITFGEIGAA